MAPSPGDVPCTTIGKIPVQPELAEFVSWARCEKCSPVQVMNTAIAMNWHVAAAHTKA